MELNRQLGSRIRLARKEAGFTQRDLGTRIHKTAAAIAYLELGKRKISSSVLSGIARATNKPITFFYGEENAVEFQLSKSLALLSQELETIKELMHRSERERLKALNETSLTKEKLESTLFAMETDETLINDVLMDLNECGVITGVSKSIESVENIGYSQSELLGKHFSEFITKEDVPRIMHLVQEGLEKPGHFDNKLIEGKLLAKNGSIIDVEGKGISIGNGKKAAGFKVVLRDIRERKVAEDKLKRIYESIPLSILLIRRDTGERYRIEACNQQFLNETGYRENEVKEKIISDIMPEDFSAQFLEYCREAENTTNRLQFKRRVSFPIGEKTFIISLSPILANGKDCTHLLCVAYDATNTETALESLERFEYKYSSALNLLSDIIVSVNPEGQVTSINRGVEMIPDFGYTAKEIIGKYCSEFIAPESKINMLRIAEEATRNGYWPENALVECKLVSRTGNLISMEGKGVVLRKNENIIGFQLLLRDTRQRQKEEKLLRESEKRYQELFESSPVGIFRCSPQGSLIDVNRELIRLLGAPDKQTLLTYNILSDAKLQKLGVTALFQKCVAEKQSCEMELPIATSKWGKTGFTSLKLTPILEHHELVEVQGILEDITHHKLSQLQKKDQEQSFKSLFTAVNTATLLISTKGRIIKANQAIYNLSGWTPEEIEGKHFWEIGGLRMKDLPKLILQFKTSTHKKIIPQNLSFTMVDKHKNEHQVSATSKYIRENNTTCAILVELKKL